MSEANEFPERRNYEALNYERERRFIVSEKSILHGAWWHLIEQGYIWAVDGYAIRARVELSPERSGDFSDFSATFTAKGPRIGDEREEYEIEVDSKFAREIIARSDLLIRKRRYKVIDQGTWDIDEFLGDNEGLVIAELEAGKDPVARQALREMETPKWAYKEVTSDTRFNNEELAKNPVSSWEEESDWKPDSPWDWD
ncbi:hypothetical protein ACIBM3_22865 [Rhodococcus erythropolis]|uniref:hypothetical protein n=1 Tax=Rhodococcus erythropolis TaxID=1833 RepID=UPI0037BC2E34